MDAKYFKCQIMEELDGAEDYIKRSIEIKPMTITWGKKFRDMASQEMEHAKTLYSLYKEYMVSQNKNRESIPDYMMSIDEKIEEGFMKRYADIKRLIDYYDNN